ncbi:MAG: L-threonylcarbamoyladenylate synthase [Salibacteraceae bacterium]
MIEISKDIDRAAQILSRGGLVAIPTETVYGLAGNIFDETAIKSIFEKKNRPLFNPLIVHVKSMEYIQNIASYIPPKAEQLADAFWPGPLTLVLKKKAIVPHIITAGKDTVAIRMPDHPVTQQLLRAIDFPLAAPSANPFGKISPTNAEHVASYFENDLEMVLDGGQCKRGIESTIVGFNDDTPALYRLGSISKEEVEKIIGPIESMTRNDDSPEAPGMLSRHYAPNTPTNLVTDVSAFLKNHPHRRIGVIVFTQKNALPPYSVLRVLSIDGDYQEAASKLYSTLHELDKLNLDMIVAERFPDEGLGKSINDRLERATKK